MTYYIVRNTENNTEKMFYTKGYAINAFVETANAILIQKTDKGEIEIMRQIDWLLV